MFQGTLPHHPLLFRPIITRPGRHGGHGPQMTGDLVQIDIKTTSCSLNPRSSGTLRNLLVLFVDVFPYWPVLLVSPCDSKSYESYINETSVVAMTKEMERGCQALKNATQNSDRKKMTSIAGKFGLNGVDKMLIQSEQKHP